MHEHRTVRITRRYIRQSKDRPSVRDLPYVFMSVLSFLAASGMSYVVYLDWQIAVATGLFVSSVLVSVFLFRVVPLFYNPDIDEEIEEMEPVVRKAPEPVTVVEPVRISAKNHTITINQPEPNAFRYWVVEVLNEPKAYFSKTQAEKRGFDYNHVVAELRQGGVVHHNSDGNGVYHLTNYGKVLLRNWVGIK